MAAILTIKLKPQNDSWLVNHYYLIVFLQPDKSILPHDYCILYVLDYINDHSPPKCREQSYTMYLHNWNLGRGVSSENLVPEETKFLHLERASGTPKDTIILTRPSSR